MSETYTIKCGRFTAFGICYLHVLNNLPQCVNHHLCSRSMFQQRCAMGAKRSHHYFFCSPQYITSNIIDENIYKAGTSENHRNRVQLKGKCSEGGLLMVAPRNKVSDFQNGPIRLFAPCLTSKNGFVFLPRSTVHIL
jgi:hypothetical protein